MTNLLPIIQIVVAVLLIIFVLLQSRGGGLSTMLGGAGEVYRTKRGLEKIISIATIVLVVIFFLLGIFRLILN